MLCITDNSIKHQSFVYTQLNDQAVLSQTTQFNMITQFYIYTQLSIKTVLFQTIQFCVIIQFSSIWPIDKTLSGATTPSQSEPGSVANEEIFDIPQSSSITEVLPSDCLVS